MRYQMKTISQLPSVMRSFTTIAFIAPGCANSQDAPRKMKFTTPIPETVMTPDALKTGRGTLRFVDGVPTEKTAQMVWDQLDFGRALECMIMCTPAASLNGFRRSIRQ